MNDSLCWLFLSGGSEWSCCKVSTEHETFVDPDAVLSASSLMHGLIKWITCWQPLGWWAVKKMSLTWLSEGRPAPPRAALVLHNLEQLFLVLLQYALVSWFRKFKPSWIHQHLFLKVDKCSGNIWWMFGWSFFKNTEMASWTRLCPKYHRCLSLWLVRTW